MDGKRPGACCDGGRVAGRGVVVQVASCFLKVVHGRPSSITTVAIDAGVVECLSMAFV